MFFADIHTHILCGTDDGAKSEEEMLQMVKASYEEGTRLLFLTPHFYPAFFGDNREESEEAYKHLCKHCETHYPDLQLAFGNELYYKHDSISWMRSGLCRTMDNTGYLLVEFAVKETEDRIAEGVYRLQNMGYTPIIAHAERYRCLSNGRIWSFRQNGVLIQINSESVFRTKDFMQNRRTKALIAEGYVDFVSSDAHNMNRRPPAMKKSYEFFAEKYGHGYAKDVYYNNAMKIFGKKGSEEA